MSASRLTIDSGAAPCLLRSRGPKPAGVPDSVGVSGNQDSMELVEIEGLAARAAAACRAALAEPGSVELRRALHTALQPLADRSFEPFPLDATAHTRGLINQSAFMADIVRGHIEDSWRTDAKANAVQALQRSSEGLLRVLNDIKKKAR